MTMWLIFLALAVFGILFVLWRLQFPIKSQGHTDGDLAANITLFQEKLAQMQGQKERGEIDDSQFKSLELEYQRQFLADNQRVDARTISQGGRLAVVIGAVLVPLLSVVLYLQLGAFDEMKLRTQLEERSELLMSSAATEEKITLATRRVIETMNELAEKTPEDPTYHVLLARLYVDQGEYAKAVPHYLKVTVLLPENGNILAEYAQVLFFAGNNQMSDQISELAFKALKLSPRNQTALSMAGIASFQADEFKTAIDYWTQALAMLPPGAPSGIALESGIAAAKERLGEAPVVVAESQQAGLTLLVSLGDDVDVPGDTTVFVYARTWQGSPMPLAITRMKVSDLPAEVTLTESMAMTPEMSLATVEQVEVVARVSLSGAPTPAAGDYEAAAGPVEVKTQENPISLPIITRIP